VSHATSTLGRATIGFASPQEIDDFVETLGRFERGEIDGDAWRAFRLVAGTYGQRQEGDLSMLRVKIPQGILTSAQLEAVADVAERFSRGFAHVTTRQNLQLHFVRLHEVAPAMEGLAAAGLTTREACGNAVRNVTMSPTAGVSHDEIFDPTAYADALTHFLLRHPLSSSLPRKFKIAFTGGGADHSFALINDLGWHARIERRGGRDVRGFRLTVGGGTALWCQSGRELSPFVPAEEMFGVTLAILRVFQARGDRVHRHKNRLRYLIKAMGWQAWVSAFEEELAKVREEGVPMLPFDAERPPEGGSAQPPTSDGVPRGPLSLEDLLAGDAPRGPGLVPRHLPLVADRSAAEERFRRTNVKPQRQDGYAVVTIGVPLGDITSGRLRAIARIASHYGEGAVRTTSGQNLVLRWVRKESVGALFDALVRIGLSSSYPESVADATSCPGAESCKLAVTQSRGLARAISDAFENDDAVLRKTAGLDVRISGCPNGCGLHHVAGLGFQGGLRKVGGRAVPYYHVYAGGDPSGDNATFGRVVGKVPARRVTLVVERLAALYEARRAGDESMTAYLGRAPIAELKAAIADLEALAPETATADDFVDFAETTPFRPETQEGECAGPA